MEGGPLEGVADFGFAVFWVLDGLREEFVAEEDVVERLREVRVQSVAGLGEAREAGGREVKDDFEVQLGGEGGEMRGHS